MGLVNPSPPSRRYKPHFSALPLDSVKKSNILGEMLYLQNKILVSILTYLLKG